MSPLPGQERCYRCLRIVSRLPPFDRWGYEFTTQLTTSTWTSDFLGNLTSEAWKLM